MQAHTAAAAAAVLRQQLPTTLHVCVVLKQGVEVCVNPIPALHGAGGWVRPLCME